MNFKSFESVETGGDGLFHTGKDGVLRIATPRDKTIDLIEYADKTLCYVKSKLGYPAIYQLHEADFQPRAEAVLMDLDGTSIHSEEFWVWIIERTMQRLMDKPKFSFEEADLPFVSGHSVSVHLQYAIDKYCPGKTVEEARAIYQEVFEFEMDEIMQGRGRKDAFTPAPHLKEFLCKLKENGIKIGLVTSGLYKKAMPEIVSAFRQLDMGEPEEFYDAIITSGQAFRNGQSGTITELALKPHPWLYAETALIGLGIPFERRNRVIGLEDSSAGVVSVRLAGFACVEVAGGNIESAGMSDLCSYRCNDLLDALKIVL